MGDRQEVSDNTALSIFTLWLKSDLVKATKSNLLQHEADAQSLLSV